MIVIYNSQFYRMMQATQCYIMLCYSLRWLLCAI